MNDKMRNRILLFCAVLLAASCSRTSVGDSAPVQIYLQQTSVLAGSVNRIYKVPSSEGSYRIDYDRNVLDVVLSVGLNNVVSATEAVTVKVAADVSASAYDAVDYMDGAVLPEDVYTLPSEVSLAASETE